MNFLHASVAGAICLSVASHSWGAALSLQDCLQRAHDNNPVLKSAGWDSGISREGSRLAKASAYPRLDIHGGYTMQAAPQAVKLGANTAETQEPDYMFAGIAATHTLYDFGRRDARIRQAEALTEATSQSFMFRRGDISLQVIEAYFRLLESGRLIEAAQEEVVQITEHRRVAQVLLDEGVVTRNDLLQAEVRLAAAAQKRVAATNRRENAWLLLNFLTGRDQDFRSELDESAAVPAAGNNHDALLNRHDIKAQKQLLEVREFEVRENRENYLPEFYTRLGMDYVQNDKVREQALFSATLGIRINLFDGYASQASHEKAVKMRSQQQDALRLTEQRAQLEVATSRNDAVTAKERISVAEAAIRQSEENLRINRERYQERVGTASEVLDAQALVTQTKTDYYRALFDYQTSTARLQHARGEL